MSDIQQAEALNKHFFQHIDVQQLLQVFDRLEHTLVWLKDLDSRIMFANRFFLQQYGFESLSSVLGKSDSELTPAAIARQFLEDDQKVISGSEIRDRLELNIMRSGEIGWYETSKFPLFSTSGTIVGSYGFSRHRDASSIPLVALTQLEASVDYVRNHYHLDIDVQTLAEISCVSISALERRFKKYLHKTPKQFISDVRMENARRLLQQNRETIVEISQRCGYDDPNYFARVFKRYYGVAPSQYRVAGPH